MRMALLSKEQTDGAFEYYRTAGQLSGPPVPLCMSFISQTPGAIETVSRRRSVAPRTEVNTIAFQCMLVDRLFMEPEIPPSSPPRSCTTLLEGTALGFSGSIKSVGQPQAHAHPHSHPVARTPGPLACIGDVVWLNSLPTSGRPDNSAKSHRTCWVFHRHIASLPGSARRCQERLESLSRMPAR